MTKQNDLDWLIGGGECGDIIRSIDWSKNSLGPIEQWPQSLKTAVSLCLSSTFPINIVWGPDHVQIYNDAYRPICGALHPASMGTKFKELWASALPVVGGAFDRGFHGEGTYIANQQMMLERYGYLEEAFMTFSFSPIRDESGKVGGIFHPITESTEKMLSSRRTQIIRDLAIQVGLAKSVPEIFEAALKLKKTYEHDLPFLTFFEEGEVWSTLGAQSSLTKPSLWKLAEKNEITHFKDLEKTFGVFHAGPFEEAPREAIILPVFAPGTDTPLLHIVAGVSSRREIDSEYMSFFEMLKNTISTAVTNVRAYEEEQRRAKALAEIDKAKTAFFSNVSHEFRTPLTLILGPLEDSLNDLDNPLNQTQRQRQEVIHRNSLRLLKLVNSLLDFSRIEAGRVQANFEPVDVSKFTGELASLFRSTVEKVGLELVVETSPMPEELYVDKEMWEKIILNLLSNAFKFTFDGRITVKSRWIETGAEIVVADTGIGISAAELPRLFERFHRVQGAQSRTYEGSGIGLALVQELVRMQGGEITASSTEGQGTSFTIFIPKGTAHLPMDKVIKADKMNSTSVSSAAYIQEAQSWNHNQQNHDTLHTDHVPLILLADDNSDMRDYVASIIKNQWRVVTAANGQEAFDLALKIKPDLILTDVMMPVLDGFGFLDKIRTSEILKLTPTVLLSARAGEEAKLEGLNAGADDYLVKPFSAKELTTRIEALLKMNDFRFKFSQELAENAQKFKSTFAHASVNIAMLDLNGVILQINESFLKRSGYTIDEVVGKHFSEITHPDDIAPNLSQIEKLTKGEIQSTSFEKRYLKKDGSTMWVKTSISIALGENKTPLYMIAVSQDIESIKNAEAKYRTAVKDLEEEKDLREKFVATLTHDLRSPMTAAKMSAQLIQRKPDNREGIQTQAARVVSSVNRADQMIQDLLDANRIHAGEQLPLTIEECSLDHIISDCLDDLTTLHGDRFRYIPEKEELVGFWSHSGLIRALENLVNNAVKYGDQYAPVTLLSFVHGNTLELRVHNEGNPIDQKDLQTIFDPYKRTSDANSGKQKGWGLGLTLVKGVIEAMGGTVEVTSSPQEGTNFIVTLPMDSREFYNKYK